jgi:hypothetical protein
MTTKYKMYMFMIRWYRGSNRDENRRKVFEDLFARKNLSRSIRQMMIPAFLERSEETVWFDSRYGENIKSADQELDKDIKA